MEGTKRGRSPCHIQTTPWPPPPPPTPAATLSLVYSPGAWQQGLEQGGEGQRAPWGEFSGVPGRLADFDD